MSIDRTDYIIYGWKLPHDMKDSNGKNFDYWDDKYLSMIDGHEGEEFIIVRCDGGDVDVAFGKLLAVGGDEELGWGFTPLNFEGLDEEKVKNKYRKLFFLEANEEIADPYVFIFSRFS